MLFLPVRPAGSRKMKNSWIIYFLNRSLCVIIIAMVGRSAPKSGPESKREGAVTMKNKVAVTIAGQEYTMVAVEDEAYVQKCAALVDKQLR